jgi:hypothetical protein
MKPSSGGGGFGGGGGPAPVVGGGGGGTDLDAGCLMLVVVLTVGPVLYGWLYPLASVAIVGLYYGAAELARQFAWSEGVALTAVIVTGIVAFIGASRLEHRLARWRVYRWPRHLLRLLIPAAAVLVYAQVEDFLWMPQTDEEWKIYFDRNWSTFAWALGAMAGAQVLLFLARWPRELWHEMLEKVWLKAR